MEVEQPWRVTHLHGDRGEVPELVRGVLAEVETARERVVRPLLGDPQVVGEVPERLGHAPPARLGDEAVAVGRGRVERHGREVRVPVPEGRAAGHVRDRLVTRDDSVEGITQ